MKLHSIKNFQMLVKKLNTNSFHNYAIRNLANNFENIAEANDNSVEIAYAKKEKNFRFNVSS